MKKIKLIILFILIISSAALSARTENTLQKSYVNSIEDFRCHIEAHKHRVYLLGMYLLNDYPNLKKMIIEMGIEDFLKLHDNAKQNKQTLVSLYSFYGENYRSLEMKSKDDFERFKNLISNINKYDDKIRADFFYKENFKDQKYSYNKEVIEFFEMIESIADLVDRGMDVVASEEFGEKMKLYSEYIYPDSPEKIKRIEKAKFLEDSYFVIVTQYSFNDYCVGK